MWRLGLVLSIVLLILAPGVKAQEVTPLPLPSLSDLKLQYRLSLDSYRAKEEQFSIAAQQYYTLKTLAAQEEAVRAAREVGLARVDTVLIYIQTLRTTLDTKNGIELSRKNTLQRKFQLLVETLKKHRARVELATNRLLIEQENNFMEDQQKDIEGVCYEALSLIKIGAIQAAWDQLDTTKDSLDAYISTAPISETARNEKQRGSDEISRSIDAIKLIITEALNAYDVGLENADNSLFRKVQEILGPAYAKLTQAQEFVRELAR